VSNYSSGIEEAEIIGRVSTDGRFHPMSEEEAYQPGSYLTRKPFIDRGHCQAFETKAKRDPSSTKAYSTREFSTRLYEVPLKYNILFCILFFNPEPRSLTINIKKRQ
jgi:hypothetical protein